MIQQRFSRLQQRIASMSQREKQLRKLRGLLEEAVEAVIHHHGPIGRLSEYGEVLAKGSDGEVLMTGSGAARSRQQKHSTHSTRL